MEINLQYNILILLGFAIRALKYWADGSYPFGFKAEGWLNLKKYILNFVLVCFIYWLSFFYHIPIEQREGLIFIGVLLIYFVIGWGSESLMSFAIDTVQSFIKYLINKFFNKGDANA